MFIYILNLLNDSLKKKSTINERSDFEIINDTWYISQLAGIKKNFDIKNITEKIIDTFEVLNKYNLTNQDSIGILNKLIKTKNNSWILEYFYNGDNILKEESEIVLSSIINNTYEKRQKERRRHKNMSLEEIKNVG
ncbi:hypothetical protein psyc5s11_24420 [Clostridium gelidum]|uniref:Uncharacterized protein n=1 Tax=Clostridium gelidum TaxID=704125 RepID=A0ABN6IW46_9CLOT|nr:hypothetical protein [Clostridium gelidum]BCZ46375.1 hypothetical protein psyc5s11_24420 [Clostridium gelidum]